MDLLSYEMTHKRIQSYREYVPDICVFSKKDLENRDPHELVF